MKQYQVVVCYEFGGTINIMASSEEEATNIVEEMLDDTGIGEDDTFECVHRDYFVNDVQSIEDYDKEISESVEKIGTISMV